MNGMARVLFIQSLRFDNSERSYVCVEVVIQCPLSLCTVAINMTVDRVE